MTDQPAPLALTTLADSRTDLCRAFTRMFTPLEMPLARIQPGAIEIVGPEWDDAMTAIGNEIKVRQAQNQVAAEGSDPQFLADLPRAVRADMAMQDARTEAA